MDCVTIREAISALLDSEHPGLPGSVIDAHLTWCGTCEAWRQRAQELTWRAMLADDRPDRDWLSPVLAPRSDR